MSLPLGQGSDVVQQAGPPHVNGFGPKDAAQKVLVLLTFLYASGWFGWIRFERTQTWSFAVLYVLWLIALDPLVARLGPKGAVGGFLQGLVAGIAAYLLLPAALVALGQGKFSSLYGRWELPWLAVIVSLMSLCWLPGTLLGWLFDRPRSRAIQVTVFAGAVGMVRVLPQVMGWLGQRGH